MAKYILVIFLMGIQVIGYSQSIEKPLGLGLGAYSRGHASIFSALSNQASLTAVEKFAVGIYSGKPYLLPALTNHLVSGGLKLKPGHIGTVLQFFKAPGYTSSSMGVLVARRLNTVAAVAAQFNYHSITIAGYGSTSAIGAEFGVLYHLNDHWHAGIRLSNIAGGKFSVGDEQLPREAVLGIGFEASSKFLFTVELMNEILQSINVQAGFSYSVTNKIQIQSGIGTGTAVAWLAAMVRWRQLRAGITVSFHSTLGQSPGMMLLFRSPAMVSQIIDNNLMR